VYNLVSSKKLQFDKWSFLDLLTGILNIISVLLIEEIKANNVDIIKEREPIDYFMILTIFVTWVRFFCYFLVIRDTSKLILTLIEMIIDTINFIVIITCILIIMASIFTTVFQDTDPTYYGNLFKSFRTLFDATLGVFVYNDPDKVIV
jgi:hypothetical protein